MVRFRDRIRSIQPTDQIPVLAEYSNKLKVLSYFDLVYYTSLYILNEDLIEDTIPMNINELLGYIMSNYDFESFLKEYYEVDNFNRSIFDYILAQSRTRAYQRRYDAFVSVVDMLAQDTTRYVT